MSPQFLQADSPSLLTDCDCSKSPKSINNNVSVITIIHNLFLTLYLVPGVRPVSVAESRSVVTELTLVTREEAASVATAR